MRSAPLQPPPLDDADKLRWCVEQIQLLANASQIETAEDMRNEVADGYQPVNDGLTDISALGVDGLLSREGANNIVARAPTQSTTVSWDVSVANQIKANIRDDSISNAMLEEMAANTVKANITGASANPTNATFAAFIAALGLMTSVSIQAFTASATYTPTTGMKYCLVFATAGGGGGGGADGLDGSSCPSAGGGGSSPTTVQIFSAATIGASQTVTIGAAGTAGSNTGTDGGDGGDTSFGSLLVVLGGDGGDGSSTAAENTFQPGGLAGSVSTAGAFSLDGQAGQGGFGNNPGLAVGGYGGGTFWGPGGHGQIGAASTGNGAEDGKGYGSGGGGATSVNSTGGFAGGAGKAGFVLVIEFC